uniref:Uncharacterized protein n=1 Tax=Anguilla anguilla TaxID=7936 RepID=A0A0E9U959_ANGAN
MCGYVICHLQSEAAVFNLYRSLYMYFFRITGNLKDCCVFVNNGHRVHCACERLLSRMFFFYF